MKNSAEIFELRKILDDSRFNGFECESLHSAIGRRDREEDFVLPYEANRVHSLWKHWDTPEFDCEAGVSVFNDYPSARLGKVPIFSSVAVYALERFLKDNGELLPISNRPFGRQYYCFHAKKMVKGSINLRRSKGVPFDDLATRFFSLERYDFYKTKIPEHPIFRIAEVTNRILVRREFVDAVLDARLSGFEFRRAWPHARKPVVVTTDCPQQFVQVNGRRRSLIAETLVVKLPVKESPANKRDETRAKRVREQLSAVLTPTSADEIPLGASQGIDSEEGCLRLDFSCPDAKRLFEALAPCLRNIGWRGFRVYKRPTEFFDLAEPLIEFSLDP